jgi:streptogramin lyase
VFSALAAAFVAGCGGSTSSTATPGHVVSGSVSGEVRAGVTITLSGASSAVTTTDGAGAYAFKGLPTGSYVVKASLAGYGFVPFAGRQIAVADADVASQDFIASATHHDIRGAVSGVTVAGVQISLSGASSATTTTAADGTYAFPGLLDGTYTITPSHAGDGFAPGARTVTLSGADAAGQDFIATQAVAPTHLIAGKVSGAVASGVTLQLRDAGGSVSTIATDAAGAYAFPGLPDGAYSVTPLLTGYTFSPRSRAVTLNGADAPSQDFVAAALAVTPGGGSGGGTGGGGGAVGDPRIAEVATGGHVAYGIAIGNDTNAWITDDAGGTVSRVILYGGSAGAVSDTVLTPADAEPTAIALRYFGRRCFTEARANRIGCLDWNGAVAFTVDVPTPASGLVDIINGPGSAPQSPDMWFAEHDAGKIGRMSIDEASAQASGTIVAEYPLPAGCQPTALTWANDGNVWWAAEGCRRIGWIVPDTGAVETVPVEVGRPIGLTLNLGEAGVWFVDAASDRLGRLTSAGGLSWFSPPVAGSGLTAVTLGPDQAVYVTESAGNAIARFALAAFDPNADPNTGRLAEELALPTAGAKPFRITSGGDGNLWFTERGQARIGVVHMSAYCIGGTIALADRTPVVGAVVTAGATDGTQRTASTGSDGYYQVCGLPAGTYVLTPSAASRTFTPPSITVVLSSSNVFSSDFTAQ